MVKFPVAVSIEALDNVTAKTRSIVGGISRATAPLRQLGTSFRGLSEAAQFPKLLDGFRGVGSALGDLASAGRRAAFIVGGITTAVGGAIFGVVHGFAEAGDSATKGALKIGIGVEALQELRYAADLANLETGLLDTSMIKLARTAALAARGQRTARIPFERLGIAVEDSNGQIRKADDLLAEIADKFGQLDDPAKKAALAQELFGRAGAQLIPLLAGGARGLAEAAAEARRFGLIISTEAAAKGEEFMDTLTRVSAALKGVRNAIGVELLPILEDLAKDFRAWLTENIPRVRAFAQRLAKDLPQALKRTGEAFSNLWTKSEPVRRVLGMIFDKLGPLGTLFAALGSVLVVTLAPALASTVAAFFTLSAAILATPAGWVFAGLAAALVGLTALAVFAAANWDKLTARFPLTTALIEKLAKFGVGFLVLQLKVLGTVAEFVLGVLLKVPELVLSAFESVGQKIAAVWEGIRSSFSAVYEWIAEKLASLIEIVPDWARELAGFETGPGAKTAAAGSAGPAGAPGELAGAIARGGRIAASQAKIKIDFSNMPRGARVSSETKGDPDLDLRMGYSLQNP